MGQTFVEKIFSRKSGKRVVPGEIVDVFPDFALSHDNTAAIARIFKQIGVKEIENPERHIVILDHCVPAANEKFALNHKEVRDFVKQYGLRHFYDIHHGICHQVVVEQGYATPGSLIVGSDSHTTTYGALGAFATGIGRSEMAVIMATGKMWFRVPETLKLVIRGALPKGISSKDVMMKIIGQLGADGGLYKAVWFSGPVVQEMSIASRLVFSNMSVEMGAKIGYMEPDDKTVDFLKNRARTAYEAVYSDPDADFAEILEFDVTNLEPQIACPHSVDNVHPISAVKGKKLDQVFFGSCTNARLEDFAIVASVLRGKKIHPSIRMIVIPASHQVFIDALAKGYIQELAQAGAVIVNSGCGPCMGNHQGILAPGEVVLSTSNRNFKGRFGCGDSEIYLSSPLTAAVSALKGEIADYREMLQ